MESQWQKLSERERKMVIYGAIALALLLFYFVFWSPLQERIEQLQKSNVETRELLGWMQNSKGELRQIGQQANANAKNKISLSTAVEQSVKRNHLETSKPDIKQLDQTHVQVTFEKVEFLAIIRWLQDIQTAANCKIEKVSMQKTDKHGIVRTDITLMR